MRWIYYAKMKITRVWLLVLALMPASSAWAIYCFDFTSNNQMCLQMKTQALITMMKLQNDPRFLTWTSEGQPGTKAAKEADRVMKMAQSCLTLIDCGAAAAEAQKLVGSIPKPVKGDLGDFAGQIWYGADLPHGTLDQMFDNNQKTAELPNEQHLQIGDNFTQSAGLTFDPSLSAAGADAVTLASASPAQASGSSAVGAARSAAGASSAAITFDDNPVAGGSDGVGVRGMQSNGGVQYDGTGGPAGGSWQASTSGGSTAESGFSEPYEMEQRVGSAISDDGDGLGEGSPGGSAPARATKFAAPDSDSKKKTQVALNDTGANKPDPSQSPSAVTTEPSQSELSSLIP